MAVRGLRSVVPGPAPPPAAAGNLKGHVFSLIGDLLGKEVVPSALRFTKPSGDLSNPSTQPHLQEEPGSLVWC